MPAVQGSARPRPASCGDLGMPDKTHTALSTETHAVHIHVALAMLHLCSAGHEDGMRGVGGIYGWTHYMDASLHLRPSN